MRTILLSVLFLVSCGKHKIDGKVKLNDTSHQVEVRHVVDLSPIKEQCEDWYEDINDQRECVETFGALFTVKLDNGYSISQVNELIKDFREYNNSKN